MSRIETDARLLYGDEVGTEFARRATALAESSLGKKSGSGSLTQPLSQRDCLLITYGDQLRREGESPLHTLGSLVRNRLQGIVSGVHLLPFFPYSSDDGFSVMDYHAVDPALGGWEDIEAFGGCFDLMFDAVFNHASAKGVWFEKFLRQEPGWEDAFVTIEGDPDLSAVVRPRALPLLTAFDTTAGAKQVWTTFSADQVDINFRDPEMFLRIVEVLFFYVARGAKFIRLDAIGYLWKEPGTSCIHLPQTHAAIRIMRSLLDSAAPWVRLVTETNVPHADNISYFGDGRNEAQMVYNFALPPLVLHTLATGNVTKVRQWIAGLEYPEGGATFFNFLASHDGIGLNPVRDILTAEEIQALVDRTRRHQGYISLKANPDGTQSPYEMNINYFDALSDPQGNEPLEAQVARFRVASFIQLSLRGVPGIYFHSLFGSRGDREGAESSGIPRRINRRKFELAELESELASPNGLRGQVFGFFTGFLQQRARLEALSPQSPQTVLDSPDEILALLRQPASDAGTPLLAVANVSDKEVHTRLRLPEKIARENWSDVLTPAAPVYKIKNGLLELTLPPHATAWLMPSGN